MTGLWLATALAWAGDPIHVRRDRIEVEDPIAFSLATTDIEAASAPVLDAIAAALKQRPEMALHIEVHSDSSGSDAFNLVLTQRRADAIADALEQRGIPKDRLVAAGYGETRPIETNATAEGRAKNRRVELRLQGL